MKTKKFKLVVIFGEQACQEANGITLTTLKIRLNKGDIDGVINTFMFDTEEDRRVATEMLEASDGWMANYWLYPETFAKNQKL